MADLTNPIFHDAEKARRYLEAERWPDGPVCPHCGSHEQATKLKGKSTRPESTSARLARSHIRSPLGPCFWFRCPNCGEGTQKSVAWLKDHGELQCPGCHTVFPILHREHILGIIEMVRKAGSS